MAKNSFGAAAKLRVGDAEYDYFRLAASKKRAWATLAACRSPSGFCWKICCATRTASASPPQDVASVARGEGAGTKEISFMPARVLLQDFTGVPCVVDLAAMRDALAAHGRRPAAAPIR